MTDEWDHVRYLIECHLEEFGEVGVDDLGLESLTFFTTFESKTKEKLIKVGFKKRFSRTHIC